MGKSVVKVAGSNPEKFIIAGLDPQDNFTRTGEGMTEEELRAELERQGISPKGIDQLIANARNNAQ